jgi:hypothetical protein
MCMSNADCPPGYHCSMRSMTCRINRDGGFGEGGFRRDSGFPPPPQEGGAQESGAGD